MVQPAAREALLLYKTLFQIAPEPIILMEGERFVDCNDAALVLLHFDSKSELLDRHPADLSPPAQPDGSDSRTRARAHFANALRHGTEHFAWTYRGNDGRHYALDVTLTALRFGGRTFIHSHLRDRSEIAHVESALRKSREEFLAFAKITQDWVWEVDAAGLYTYVSPRVEDFLGYAPEALLGRSPFALMPEAEAARVQTIFAGYVSERQPFKYLQNVNLHRDGRRIVLETSGVPVFDEGGRFIGYRGTDRDITESVRQKKAMESALLYHEAILETTQDGYWMIDATGTILDVNAAYCQMIGYEHAELLGMKIPEIDALERPEDTAARMRTIIKRGSHLFESRHRRKAGTIFDVEVSVSYSPIEGGRFFALIRDITDRKQSEAQMNLAARVFETMTDGVVVTDAQQTIIRVNNGFCRITGYTEAELVGKRPGMLRSGWHDAAFYARMWQSLNAKESWRGEIVDRKKSGEVYTCETSIVAIRDEQGTITNYVAVQSDVTDKKAQEQIINNLAYYDALTKLPNRTNFEERFTTRLAAAKRQKSRIALLFIDLDNFKAINDTYGHLVGDQFLRDAAARLQRLVREEDTVGRFGGDEFAVMIEHLHGLNDIGIIARKIVQRFREPFSLEGNEFYSGTSIGIAVYPEDGETYHDLMRAADTAMYAIKGAGKGDYAFFTQSMNENVSRQIRLENALRQALEREEFFVVYQPKVDIVDGCFYGVEALLRWNHPTMGLVHPDHFIPTAEESGMIYPIGLWVLRQALHDVRALNARTGERLTVSINLSARQLQQSSFVQDLCAVIEEADFERELIELEITENQVMGKIDQVLPILREIIECGIRLSIDDFGTGYSSLSYLKKLPISTVKIDRSFVVDLHADEEDQMIVSAIIALASSLKKEIVAEGVETVEQLAMLKQMGCRRVQGFYYAEPMHRDALRQYVADFRPD